MKQCYYLMVTVFKRFSIYNAAHQCCPVFSIRCCFTRIDISFHIWTAAVHLPAVSKFYCAANDQLTLGGKVILCIAIKISTQSTNLSLCMRTCFSIGDNARAGMSVSYTKLQPFQDRILQG